MIRYQFNFGGQVNTQAGQEFYTRKTEKFLTLAKVSRHLCRGRRSAAGIVPQLPVVREPC